MRFWICALTSIASHAAIRVITAAAATGLGAVVGSPKAFGVVATDEAAATLPGDA